MLAVSLALASAASALAAGDFEITAASFLGAPGFEDRVVGARIQGDGTIVLAANLGPGAKVKGLNVEAGKHGLILRLSPDGKRLLGAAAVARELKDMEIDEKDNLYLAAGADGLLKLSATGDKVLLRKEFNDCVRIDAATDGHFAAIADGGIHIFAPDGQPLGSAKGSHFTCDVCIDAASKTVVFCGFRNAHAHDGQRRQPVQIAYIHGLAYDGSRKWTNYDWATDQASDRFINKPTNNMADTRGDRCTIGRDGKLYVTFQVAGGNHIFRYSPRNIMERAAIVGGDHYHQFHNSRAEHKCFFARYDPATGDYLAGQQFCGRLSSGRANYAATKTGEINADEAGRVYIAGIGASGLPINLNPSGSDYTGGGFLLVMSPDLRARLLCTRLGIGAPHAVDARTLDGRLRIVFGGGEAPADIFTTPDSLQPQAADTGKEKGGPRDAFFALLAPRY